MRSDLIVVGAGPSGLATSIYAARSGMRVTVIERGALPRDKPCGEGLMPAGARLLDEMGVQLRDYAAIDGIRYVDGRTVAEARFATGRGVGVRRVELSRALLERAGELDVRVMDQTRAVGVRAESDGVTVDVGTATLHGDWLVAADGLNSRTRRWAGLDKEKPRRGVPRYGFRRHFRRRPWSRFVEVYWARGGEAYVTPVSGNEIGVALLWHEPASSFRAMLSRFPELEARLGGAVPTTLLKGAGPFRRRMRRVQAGRVALVGDAAGYLDALTGEGVALGFRSARAVAKALSTTSSLSSYETDYRRLSRRYVLVTRMALLLSRHPGVRRRVIRTLSRRPGIFGRLVAVLGEESNRMWRRGHETGGLHVETWAGVGSGRHGRHFVAGIGHGRDR